MRTPLALAFFVLTALAFANASARAASLQDNEDRVSEKTAPLADYCRTTSSQGSACKAGAYWVVETDCDKDFKPGHFKAVSAACKIDTFDNSSLVENSTVSSVGRCVWRIDHVDSAHIPEARIVAACKPRAN